jgi:sugar lactone lactonase YvrE
MPAGRRPCSPPCANRLAEPSSAGRHITTVAGGGGLRPRPAVSSLLPRPVDVAKDGFGNLFVVSLETATVYKVDSSGQLTVEAGNGQQSSSPNGIQATSASLNLPHGIALDAAGNLFIADSGPSVVRRVDASTGIITIVAGSPFNASFSGDGGLATNATLNFPGGVAVDSAGNIFIGDVGNHRIRRVDAATGIITTVAGNGAVGFSGDGALATNASLNLGPLLRMALDGSGNLIFADSQNYRVRRVDAFTHIITTIAGNGSISSSGDGGLATAAALNFPSGVALDSAGNLFIAELSGERIRKVDGITKLISTVAGNGTFGFSGDGGPATNATLRGPQAVSVDTAGNVFIADDGNGRVRQVNTSQIITTVAGNGSLGDGGPATSATLFFPNGVAADGAGNFYIADSINTAVRRVDAVTGAITNLAGIDGFFGFNGDGIPAVSAQLCFPLGVAVDGSRNVFIADVCNNRIRRVDAVSGLITTVAGNGTSGFSGDGGLAINASLSSAGALALDSTGNLFIADQNNQRIRRVDAVTGIIATVAGNGTLGFSGDGGLATNAMLNLTSPFSGPAGLAVDGSGNLFFTDTGNARVRRVDAVTGTITTVVGSSSSCNAAALGDGGPATNASLCFPQGVAVDPTGVVYISDNGFSVGYQRIRRVDPATGIITTIAGGMGGFSGDGGLSTSAGFDFLRGIALSGADSLFIVDANAQRIRRILLAPTVVVGLPAVSNSGNCIPFGCPASMGTTTYQQVYVSNTFPGAVSIAGIDFLNTQVLNGAVPAGGTYTLSLSYTSKSPGGLDLTNPANNITSGSQRFFSGTLPAISDGIMAFTGPPFAYDPALGNLLLTVGVSGGTDSSPKLFLDFSQTPSTETSRAFFGTITGGSAGGLVTAFVTAVTAPPSAAVLKITPPPSVQLDGLESNQSAFFFAERVSFVLPSAIAVDASSPGTYNSFGSLTPGIIPAGTVVDSFFLHADPFDPNNGVFYSGSLSFDNPILGVIALSGGLDQTDAILGAPGTLYPIPGSEPARGFELGSPDMFVISADRKTLTFSNAAAGADDQLRIVTAASPPLPVAPGTSTTFTSPNVINQAVTIPPDANMNGAATMRVSFIQVAPAVFNASIAAGTNGNAFSGGKPVPPGTTCTPIVGAGGNCIITENKCFDANGAAFPLCPITATITPILLTSQYKTLSPQPNPALLTATDGQSDYAVITTGFDPADPTISGGTKALNSDEVIANLPGLPPADTVPPVTTAATSPLAPNGANGWFTTSVTVILSSTDDQLVKQITYSATGAQTIGSTTVPGASTLFQIANQGVTTISFQATDAAGNVEVLKTLTVKIDTTPPSISITSPANGATYLLNQPVAASYACADPESSPAPSCTGPVASGSNFDTASVGSKVFTVNSTDAAGLSATQSVSYSVSYKVCTLNSPSVAVKSGAVIPLKMFLCDFAGNDVSNFGVIVHATKLMQVSTQASDTIVTAGNANPDNDFRFDSTLGPSGGYIFNLLANLPTGTYKLFFTAGNDPSTTHFLTFQVN